MGTWLLPLPVILPLATALLTMASWRRPRVQGLISGVSLGALLAVSAALLGLVWTEGTQRTSFGGWPAPFGIEFAVDPLGAAMVSITALMGAITALFSLGEADPGTPSPTRWPLTFALLAGVGGAFVTADLFNLYVWFELMLVASLGLLALGGGPRHLDAALKYFVLNALGTLLLLLAVGYLYGLTGHLGFGALRGALATPDNATLGPFVTLLVLAILIKAGAFPLCAWLPASYPTLPAPLLALFAGLLTKVGIYVLLRLLGGVLPALPAFLTQGLAWVAAATMLVGVLGAAFHWDLRRILAFHIISQIGYMLLGIALLTQAGQVATVFYVVHHIVVKANLFLVAGLVCRMTGTYDLRRAGGLYLARPALALLFAIPALSLVGLPPLSGFWAKLLVLREALAQQQLALAMVALAVGLLTLYSMLKIWLEAFWKPHPDPNWSPPSHAGLTPAYLATGLLAAVTLALGVMPEPVLQLAERAVEALGEARP